MINLNDKRHRGKTIITLRLFEDKLSSEYNLQFYNVKGSC